LATGVRQAGGLSWMADDGEASAVGRLLDASAQNSSWAVLMPKPPALHLQKTIENYGPLNYDCAPNVNGELDRLWKTSKSSGQFRFLYLERSR
jgi:hypothetical protein